MVYIFLYKRQLRHRADSCDNWCWIQRYDIQVRESREGIGFKDMTFKLGRVGKRLDYIGGTCEADR
jgi:hypothetical protein